MHFYDIVAKIQHENNFLPTSNHRPAKVRRFLGTLFVRMIHLSLKFGLSENVSKRDAILAPVAKQCILSQGCSELQEPIKTREDCHSLIW